METLTKNNSKQPKGFFFRKGAAAPLQIDYPQEGETVKAGSYTFRIAAQDIDEVEISINDGDWQPCRFSVGYWWFDWSAKTPASYSTIARARKKTGAWKKSKERTFTVAKK